VCGQDWEQLKSFFASAPPLKNVPTGSIPFDGEDFAVAKDYKKD
jgi:hypothetical protein